jgi:hypothetical protein
MCINGRAMDAPRWARPYRVKIGCMDAGFGGDRCVFHELHFGNELPIGNQELSLDGIVNQEPTPDNNPQIIALIETKIVPISGNDVKTAEDQIVVWCKNQCALRGIEPNHFFYEPGMRTSLVQKFTQIWDSRCVPIDFGGKPSDKNVSSDIPVNCREYYFNFVTELWYTVRLVIECQQFRGLTEAVMDEGCKREYKRVGGNKIQIETKIEYKEKTGFSPDQFDALVTGIEGARRLGFIVKRQMAAQEEIDEQWKTELESKAKKLWQHGRLNYAA